MEYVQIVVRVQVHHVEAQLAHRIVIVYQVLVLVEHVLIVIQIQSNVEDNSVLVIVSVHLILVYLVLARHVHNKMVSYVMVLLALLTLNVLQQLV
jgi:hypothetical protein